MTTDPISAARFWAVNRFPYLASALFAMQVTQTKHIKGVAVDESWRIYVNSDLIRSLSLEAVGTLLVHHVNHLLRAHAERCLASQSHHEDRPRWLAAADMEVNDDLQDSQLLQGFLEPASFGLPEGKLAEEYFQRIDFAQRPELDCGSGADGRARPWDLPPSTDSVSKAQAHNIRCLTASDILSQSTSRSAGDIPQGLIRWSREIVRSATDWKTILRAQVRHGLRSIEGRVDYTYCRPPRRPSPSTDVILPSMRQPMPDVAIIIDTSGSMSEEDLGAGISETQRIIETAVGKGRNAVTVMSADAAVQTRTRATSAANLELRGGGGTNMALAILEVTNLRPRPSLIVVITDGQSPWPPRKPAGIEVIVALVGDYEGSTPPDWARTVYIPRRELATAPA